MQDGGCKRQEAVCRMEDAVCRMRYGVCGLHDARCSCWVLGVGVGAFSTGRGCWECVLGAGTGCGVLDIGM